MLIKTIEINKIDVLKCFSSIIFFIFSIHSFGQNAKVGIANYFQDSLRVSIFDIVNNPTIKILGTTNAKIISYDLTLNINGVIYEWKKLKNDTLDNKKIHQLLEVKNDKPKNNQLFIERVKYIDSLGKEQNAKGLYLWLAKKTNCKGVYDIEVERYKNKWQIRFEYFWCNDTCMKVINYRKDGTINGSKEYIYTSDTIVVTNLYRKDGSKMIYERQVNGKDDGDYFIYYPDGSVKLEAKNINGIRVHEKIYNKNKILVSEIQCKNNGTNCILKKFDENGKVKKEKNLKPKGLKYKTVW